MGLASCSLTEHVYQGRQLENDALDLRGGRRELTPEGCLGLPYTPQQMHKSGSRQKKQINQ